MSVAIRSLFITLLALFSSTLTSIAAEAKVTVLVLQTANHPALDAVSNGLIEELKERYGNGNVTVRIESAQGDTVLAGQIAAKLAAEPSEAVVGIGTLAAQALGKYAMEKKVRLIFSSVTDPIKAKLVKSVTETNSSNIKGVSNFVELGPQVQLFKQLQPTLRKLGIVYNPGEANSVSILEKLRAACRDAEITLVQQSVQRTADVTQATTKLVAECDAIFISNDNTALSSLNNIIAIARKAGKPVYVSDTDAVQYGAVAALGPNQTEIGKQTARMVIDMISGKESSVAVEFPDKTELYLNQCAADKAGLAFSPALLQQAATVACRFTQAHKTTSRMKAQF